ncbi:hydroxyacid dehydrogenase [Oleiharenicola lentus]|uniref:hydroxyacid dehydrogenase n=1 Tax=Oleiharenicola lentus TaxID=2508720 RepID=UPI003F67BEDF
MIKGVLFLSSDAVAAFPDAVIAKIRERVHLTAIISPSSNWQRFAAELREAEVLITGWGAPRMDQEFMDAAPKLKAVFYAGGSVRYFTTDAFWSRGVRITTAQAVNAIPVSEYTVATALLALKRFWHYARVTREQRTFPADRPVPGAYRSVVGLVSYGTIARMVRQRLQQFDVDVVVYDPFLSESEASRHRVESVSLAEVFSRSDVVSLHAPQLPETLGMIRGVHFDAMKTGSTFINTARGEIVNEPEMISCLQRRPDIQAVLDVTAPEPPLTNSLLYSLRNVILTPHIAGSLGPECVRMSESMIEELERYLSGQPLHWEIDSQRAALSA